MVKLYTALSATLIYRINRIFNQQARKNTKKVRKSEFGSSQVKTSFDELSDLPVNRFFVSSSQTKPRGGGVKED